MRAKRPIAQASSIGNDPHQLSADVDPAPAGAVLAREPVFEQIAREALIRFLIRGFKEDADVFVV